MLTLVHSTGLRTLLWSLGTISQWSHNVCSCVGRQDVCLSAARLICPLVLPVCVLGKANVGLHCEVWNLINDSEEIKAAAGAVWWKPGTRSASTDLCSRFLHLSQSGWSTPGSCHISHSGNSSCATAVRRKNFNLISTVAAVQADLRAVMLNLPWLLKLQQKSFCVCTFYSW